MSTPVEIVTGTVAVPAGVETTVCSLVAWHPLVDVYVKGNGAPNVIGSSWRLYGIAGPLKTLLASGVFTLASAAGLQRVLAGVAGGGQTMELDVFSATGGSAVAVTGSLVGYDAEFQGTPDAESVGNALILTPADQIFGTLAAWHPSLDIFVNGNHDVVAAGSIWTIEASVGGNFYPIVTGSVLDVSKVLPVLRGFAAGALTFRLKGRALLGTTTALISAQLVGYTPEGTGGGGGGGTSIVPNIAALIALPVVGFPDGSAAYVQSIEVPWNFVTSGAALTPDGITIVNTSAGGNTRWVRDMDFGHMQWLTQGNWFIDPVAGNNENRGNTALAAVATHAEFARRLGRLPILGLNGTSVYTITIVNDLPQSDPVSLHARLMADVELFYSGGIANIQTGVITAITNQNPATNTEYAITGSTALDAGATLHQRIRITQAGPRFGAFAWIKRAGGANQCFTADFSVPNPFTSDDVTPHVPLNGDSYVVESVRQFFLGDLTFDQDPNAATTGAFVVFQDLWWPTPSLFAYVGFVFAKTVPLAFSGCRFDNAISNFNFNLAAFLNCESTSFFDSIEGNTGLLGGYYTAPAGINALFCSTGCEVQVGINAHFGSAIQCLPGADVNLFQCAVFDAAAAGNSNPDGSGVALNPGSHFSFMPDAFLAPGGPLIWGARNAGYGVQIDNSAVNYDSASLAGITITGTLGDFSLSRATKANAWVQNLGGYSTPITTSWANLAAALNAGGFGGNAHNLAREAYINPANVTTEDPASQGTVTNGTSPFTFNTESICLADVSGGVVTVNMPPAAGRTFLKTRSVTDSAGDAAVSNITVSGNGVNIEDPNAGGTFAASVLMTVKGSSVTWYFDVGNNRWKII